MKKFWIILGVIFGVVLLVLVGYVIYFFASSTRLEDNITLPLENNQAEQLATGEDYSIISYNVGFGAYSPEFSFFMDGGTESVAKDKEEVIGNINGAIEDIAPYDADFLFIQEADVKADRSHDVNTKQMFVDNYKDYGYQFAVNYDSPYIFYPITSPHGKSLAGMLTFSKYEMASARRMSLPITQSLSRVLDLDRCYSVTEVPVDNGKSLVLYQLHFTAYGGGADVTKAQIEKMFTDMKEQEDAGNYVICGGDFNHDLLGNSLELLNANVPEGFVWSAPFPYELVDEAFAYVDAGKNPTVRDCAEPYVQGRTLISIIDGFFVSPNITVVEAQNLDMEFAHSDHNPVYLKFQLQ